MDYGLHVDGFLTALLAGVVTRATVLVAMTLGPQPEPARTGLNGTEPV
jgi:putative membrane protein